MDNKYIRPDYETIGVEEKREIMELCQSTLLNAFNREDYVDVIKIFNRVIERLIGE